MTLADLNVFVATAVTCLPGHRSDILCWHQLKFYHNTFSKAPSKVYDYLVVNTRVLVEASCCGKLGIVLVNISGGLSSNRISRPSTTKLKINSLKMDSFLWRRVMQILYL